MNSKESILLLSLVSFRFGGIVDVFRFQMITLPSFFGNEVDSIRSFDVGTQSIEIQKKLP
jgi:transcription-repair coupling factor (superfamily II helicase)